MKGPSYNIHSRVFIRGLGEDLTKDVVWVNSHYLHVRVISRGLEAHVAPTIEKRIFVHRVCRVKKLSRRVEGR
jgi:hypothetical protein